MVGIVFAENFEKRMRKLKDPIIHAQIKKQIVKITQEPELGKPMQYERKGTREVYVASFRLAYRYSKEDDRITFLDFYHKNEQ